MIRIPTDRAPTHPGEMLLEEFLKPMGLTQRQLAQAIHVPYQRINEIINGRRGMTPSTALRLEKFLGMSSSFWMDLQLRRTSTTPTPRTARNWNRLNRTPPPPRTDPPSISGDAGLHSRTEQARRSPELPRSASLERQLSTPATAFGC